MSTLKAILSGEYNPNGVNEKYVEDFEAVDQLVKLAKASGYRIVLTQGVYDRWHVGHGRYLAEAASYGDILIVGLDSDELTREMKGKNRPWDSFEERVEVVSMLSFVNMVTRRHTDQHMYDLIKLVRPDVLVMSKTTSSFAEEDKEALQEFCGRIEHLEPKAPPKKISTTAKILMIQREGAEELAKLIVTRLQHGGVEELAKLITNLVDEVVIDYLQGNGADE